jgi:xanthine dehydrogenase YagT iron-sulfur-binding subunit
VCLVSSSQDSKNPKKPKSGVSRRGFMRGAGIGGGLLGSGILDQQALAAPAGEAQFMGPGPVPVTLKINGKTHTVHLEPRVTLCDALRNYLDMTGAKRVCDRATCGACTVILNGKSVYSCTVLAIDAQGKDIQTIEGISEGRPHPLSVAFLNHDAQQCGYCTPGFVMAAKALLDHNPNPTYEQVKEGLCGNLCRCGTYMGVRHAVLEAAKERKGGHHA